MKRPRLLIGILIGLHVVLAALILWRYGTMQPYEIIGLDALLIVLLPSQGNLIGFWTALGGKRTPWRVTFTVVGIVACLVVCDWCHYHDPFSHAVLLFVWQTISVGVLLLLARLAGLRLRQIGSEHMEGELRRFQFLLWQMLVWTTVLAVVVSSAHYIPSRLQPDFHLNPALARAALCCTCVALVSIWLALGRRWLVARAFLLIVTTIGLGTVTLLWQTGGRRPLPLMLLGNYCLVLFAVAAWTTASLLVVRLAGYRLTWR